MNPQHFFIRVDSSTEIGSGHVMRCLSVAGALRDQGHDCHFICRDLPGHIAKKIEIAEFGLTILTEPKTAFTPERGATAHAHWAQVDWQRDAAETAAICDNMRVDWIVLDHYGFDANWMDAAAPRSAKRLVIDDLADRKHAADLLLDQGIGRRAAHYDHLTDDKCRILAGMQYAVMKPDFAMLRDESLYRRRSSPSGRLLVALGGYDPTNITGTILSTVAETGPSAVKHIDIVLGLNALHLKEIQDVSKSMPIASKLLVDTPQMPALMLNADFAIGGAGLTAIERCVMGVPSVIVVQADNQIEQAKHLTERGAVLQYDNRTDAPGPSLAKLIDQICDPKVQMQLSKSAASICDGRGLARVIEAIQTVGVSTR